MTTFDDRKNAFEEKFAHDEAMVFKAEVRASKLFGQWLAPQLGLDGAEADSFAKDVVAANIDEPGFDDIIRFVRPSIEEKGLNISDHMINQKMAEFMDQAKAQLMSENEAA